MRKPSVCDFIHSTVKLFITQSSQCSFYNKNRLEMQSSMYLRLTNVFLWIQLVQMMSIIKKHSYFLDNGGSDGESDLADFIVSKGYLPSEKELPKTTLLVKNDNDVTYLLSKLSDEELLKLLNQPKKSTFDLNDIVNAAIDIKPPQDNKLVSSTSLSNKEKRFKTVSDKDRDSGAYFRLEDKPVDPYATKTYMSPDYAAFQKLNNLLYSQPQEDDRSEEDDEKKQLLFDVLVAQLRTLCCKKRNKHDKKNKLKSILNQLVPQEPTFKQNQITSQQSPKEYTPNEYMFLIINDEIKSNGSDDELISVDPESLETNSSVLLLGPINTPLSNVQLKTVMSRISNELSKSEYLPLLQQLSEGTLSGSNVKLMKSLVTGPDTRRYIKPHRCNHQSPLAKIYGGPKWLICTGYLNLNVPSLYD